MRFPVHCVLPLSILLLLMGCSTPRPYPESSHYDGRRFFHPVRVPEWSFGQLLSHIKDGHGGGDWPDHVCNADTAQRLDRASEADELTVTHVNHSTVLIQIGGTNILTDPVWSTRVGAFGRFGPKRVRRPGVPFDRLPTIDVILISHDHYDHLDLPTLRRIHRRDTPIVLAPLGNTTFLESYGIASVTEMDWWDDYRLDRQTRIVFAPARHLSGRTPWTRRRSLWGSFLVQHGELSVYFAGDTAYGKHFRTTRERFGPVDLTLLPIGGYKPRMLHRSVHMDPADAVRAHDDLQTSYSIAIHHGTFRLSAQAFDEPVSELRDHLTSEGRSTAGFLFDTEGVTLLFDTSGSTIDLINAPDGSQGGETVDGAATL